MDSAIHRSLFPCPRSPFFLTGDRLSWKKVAGLVLSFAGILILLRTHLGLSSIQQLKRWIIQNFSLLLPSDKKKLGQPKRTAPGSEVRKRR
jgi:hypothetical protein